MSGSAVVVGGASGIGAAVARRLRERGERVVVWDVKPGADLACDVTDEAQLGEAVRATLERIGVPNTVTLTAGIGHQGALLDVPADAWDRVMGVNAKGVWLAMRALARPMLEHGGGSIVTVTSVSGQLVDPSMGLYCASKAALDMLTRVAAVEWAPSLRVNGVAPGVTDTPMLGPAARDGAWLRGVAERTVMRRLGTPDDVAETVEAVHAMHWVTGQIFACDGGLSLHSPITPGGAGPR